MTDMIYRGWKHDIIRNVKPRVPQDLIYRGVGRDGLQPVQPLSDCEFQMVYRGIRYIVSDVERRTGKGHPATCAAMDRAA